MTYAMGTSEAATYAGVPADAIRDAITRGDLPAGRVGKRRLLIRRADLEAWVDSRIALGSQEGDDA